ncbi:hypothetical protein CEXT_809331 [Caerostris extrusa]|uniref:Uncharacterized protein n=1 Tax=Caerostris extrusa TaxID=172846 RepID=A0AAV4T4W1_CAEEX|nr:hypothetical protein CEXT_809331 [Caerostris extrusa]
MVTKVCYIIALKIIEVSGNGVYDGDVFKSSPLVMAGGPRILATDDSFSATFALIAKRRRAQVIWDAADAAVRHDSHLKYQILGSGDD